MYTVFTRNWWRYAPEVINSLDSSLNGLEPDPGARKRKLASFDTEDEAKDYAMQWNATHKPGRLSRMAEYTSDY